MNYKSLLYSRILFAGIAEFERDLIRERPGAGHIAVIQRGVRFGRPEKMNEEQKLLAKRLLQEDKSVMCIKLLFIVYRLSSVSRITYEKCLYPVGTTYLRK